MLAIGLGGRAWIYEIAQFHGVALALLAVLGILIIAAFRSAFLAGGPLARLHAARDAAFLAAIAAGGTFIVSQARWSLGSTIVALEFGLAIELLSRLSPAASTP